MAASTIHIACIMGCINSRNKAGGDNYYESYGNDDRRFCLYPHRPNLLQTIALASYAVYDISFMIFKLNLAIFMPASADAIIAASVLPKISLLRS